MKNVWLPRSKRIRFDYDIQHREDHAIESRITCASTCLLWTGITHAIHGRGLGSRVSHYYGYLRHHAIIIKWYVCVCVLLPLLTRLPPVCASLCLPFTRKQSNFCPEETLHLKSLVIVLMRVVVPAPADPVCCCCCCCCCGTKNDAHWYKRNVISFEAVSNMHRWIIGPRKAIRTRTNENVFH